MKPYREMALWKQFALAIGTLLVLMVIGGLIIGEDSGDGGGKSERASAEADQPSKATTTCSTTLKIRNQLTVQQSIRSACV
jgi:hypothetical protein